MVLFSGGVDFRVSFVQKIQYFVLDTKFVYFLPFIIGM